MRRRAAATRHRCSRGWRGAAWARHHAQLHRFKHRGSLHLQALAGQVQHFIRTWSGTEGYLPDRQPVLGKSHTTPGLIHGFGFAGAGFQIGPGVGEVLAELARDGRSTTPIDAFAIERFLPTTVADVASTAAAH